MPIVTSAKHSRFRCTLRQLDFSIPTWFYAYLDSNNNTHVQSNIRQWTIAQWRHAAHQNILPDHSWIKLYVNIQVDWSGGPLNRLWGVICNRSVGFARLGEWRKFDQTRMLTCRSSTSWALYWKSDITPIYLNGHFIYLLVFVKVCTYQTDQSSYQCRWRKFPSICCLRILDGNSSMSFLELPSWTCSSTDLLMMSQDKHMVKHWPGTTT